MASPHELPSLGLEPPDLLKVSPLLRQLQEQGPICRVRTPAGDEGWLVTRHAALKQLLHDERFGHSHPDPANAAQYVRNPFLDLMITDTDAEAGRRTHAESRRLLAPMFSARRVREMEPKVVAVVDDVLDRFIAQGPPADLHDGLCVPVALTVSTTSSVCPRTAAKSWRRCCPGWPCWTAARAWSTDSATSSRSSRGWSTGNGPGATTTSSPGWPRADCRTSAWRHWP